MPSLGRLILLIGGCIVLGIGVGLLLTADRGSDGYSTLVNGVALSTGLSFWVANLLVSLVFLAAAAGRRVYPGIGTVVQIVLVGVTVTVALELMSPPDGWPARIALLVGAFPVLAVGIATYLGSKTGAGPAEAAALAWDPPVPFKWTYSVIQGGGALGGWLLGATIGAGTIAVIVLLGPLVDLAAKLLRVDIHQGSTAEVGPG